MLAGAAELLCLLAGAAELLGLLAGAAELLAPGGALLACVVDALLVGATIDEVAVVDVVPSSVVFDCILKW